ncbi:hypothetical protein [Streptomyces sp.]|uniref:hypothetical protein n=1 Tax=Streptomyces sp. TaxID=1931 RepID=UPI002F3F680B
MAERDDRPVGALLDGLSGRTRRTLARAGFDMPRLRELASTPPGERQVRHIVSEFGLFPAREAGLKARFRAQAPALRVAAGWAGVLGGAAAGLAAVCAASVLGDRLLGLLTALIAAVGVVALLVRTPESRGRDLAHLLGLAAVAVLFFTAFLHAPQWYLAVRGEQVAATLATPVATWAHGSLVPHCRVRLPDGSVHRVDQDDRGCATATGRRVQVVHDPAGHLSPELGDKGGLGAISAAVAATAGLVLLGTATAAVAAAGRGG